MRSSCSLRPARDAGIIVIGREHQAESIDDVLARLFSVSGLTDSPRDLDDTSNDPALLVGFLIGDRQPEFLSHGQEMTRPGTTKLMQRRPVRSSMLASVGYDKATATLEVAFVEGGIYQYFEVPSDVHAGLMSASSHGAYFDSHVKQAGYRYAKIG